MQDIARVTPTTLAVLARLVESGDPTWGLQLVKATQLKSGTVYPILDRLEELGWVSSYWEQETERSGARRRLYELTRDGRTAAETLVAKHGATGTAPAKTSEAPSINPGLAKG
jgi:PadR family transcriptional regulator PadR